MFPADTSQNKRSLTTCAVGKMKLSSHGEMAWEFANYGVSAHNKKDPASLLETQGLLSPLLYFETVTAPGLRTRILTGLVVLVGSAMHCIRPLQSAWWQSSCRPSVDRVQE